jgi:YegS/Rv2252/BmrU family lipid kinase
VLTSPAAPHLPRPITLLVNGHSRRGRAEFRQVIQELEAAGIPLGDKRLLRNKRETEQFLRREVEEGAKTVIIGGGDGTLSACADYLVNTPVAMGILPLGTGNTFVRSVGIPLAVAEAARTIAEGHVEGVDVGRVNEQIFINSVTLGLSAEIAAALDTRTKRRLGLLAWPVVGIKMFVQHRPLTVRITSAEKSFAVRTHQLVIANGRYVAGPITASPDASLQNSRLDVFVLGGAKRRSLAYTAWQWLRGEHIHTPETRYFTSLALHVESLRRPYFANIDGEVNDRTPLDLEVLPRALKVVVPRGFDADET